MIDPEQTHADVGRAAARGFSVAAAARHPKFGLPFLGRLSPSVSGSRGLKRPKFALFAKHLPARKMRRSADFQKFIFFESFRLCARLQQVKERRNPPKRQNHDQKKALLIVLNSVNKKLYVTRGRHSNTGRHSKQSCSNSSPVSCRLPLCNVAVLFDFDVLVLGMCIALEHRQRNFPSREVVRAASYV